MKTKKLAAITLVLIVSIALASYGYAAAAPKAPHEKPAPSQRIYNTYTLTAEGTAKNSAQETVAITLSIEGNANGKLKTVFHLHTQGGEATIGYDTISAVRGQGIVVNKNNFIHVNIMMSSDAYGGKSTLWVLRGTTEDLTDVTTPLPISLHAPRVVLPIEGNPRLTNLALEGIITFH